MTPRLRRALLTSPPAAGSSDISTGVGCLPLSVRPVAPTPVTVCPAGPGLPEWPVRGPVRPGRPAAVVGRAQRTYPTAGSAYAETLIRRTQHTDSLEEQ
ncbi:hypothetical protein [Actinacidiphila alni]|uniref:hypothetical protein n=1 Tax=Actinacidiphila alni TaxID=380248 RepID=UPI0034512AB6